MNPETPEPGVWSPEPVNQTPRVAMSFVTRWILLVPRGLQGAIDRLRAWFDPPLELDARPLEIREAIIDCVERRAEPAAAGRRVLPHNLVSVTVMARDK